MENEHVFAHLYGQLHLECAQSIKPEFCSLLVFQSVFILCQGLVKII